MVCFIYFLEGRVMLTMVACVLIETTRIEEEEEEEEDEEEEEGAELEDRKDDAEADDDDEGKDDDDDDEEEEKEEDEDDDENSEMEKGTAMKETIWLILFRFPSRATIAEEACERFEVRVVLPLPKLLFSSYIIARELAEKRAVCCCSVSLCSRMCLRDTSRFLMSARLYSSCNSEE
jgi:hypothetical protein